MIKSLNYALNKKIGIKNSWINYKCQIICEIFILHILYECTKFGVMLICIDVCIDNAE